MFDAVLLRVFYNSSINFSVLNSEKSAIFFMNLHNLLFILPFSSFVYPWTNWIIYGEKNCHSCTSFLFSLKFSNDFFTWRFGNRRIDLNETRKMPLGFEFFYLMTMNVANRFEKWIAFNIRFGFSFIMFIKYHQLCLLSPKKKQIN